MKRLISFVVLTLISVNAHANDQVLPALGGFIVGSSILWVDNSGDAKADMCVIIVEVGLSELLNSTTWLVP